VDKRGSKPYPRLDVIFTSMFFDSRFSIGVSRHAGPSQAKHFASRGSTSIARVVKSGADDSRVIYLDGAGNAQENFAVRLPSLWCVGGASSMLYTQLATAVRSRFMTGEGPPSFACSSQLPLCGDCHASPAKTSCSCIRLRTPTLPAFASKWFFGRFGCLEVELLHCRSHDG
jgi:hypothetical protein